MANLTIPISLSQLLDLARQLSQEERRKLLDALLAERFESTLRDADRRQSPQSDLTDNQIQEEIDEVRRQRQEARRRAIGS